MDPKTPINKYKNLSPSCKSCQRMTLIEGEYVCFKQGQVVSLRPAAVEPSSHLTCDSWKMGSLKTKRT